MTDAVDQHSLAGRFRGYYPVVVDIETAGFNATTDAMLELAATPLSMNDDGELVRLETIAFNIAPFEGANLEPSSLAFTGINPDCPERNAIAEKTALTELFKKLRALQKQHDCQRCVLVAHNAAFDNSFLNAAIQRTKHKRSPFHPFVTFDTTTLCALILGKTVLSEACELAGVDFDKSQAHSAAYDTEKTAELFCHMVNHHQALGGWPYTVAKQPQEEEPSAEI
ncbi:ribonuclease T [Echinimonas agarilytica]|uniref:Ribonuclease T n=1 Tax=Echinimonas agarilytica TaxID=1215918 RepID=A0AA42B8S4_9GAMM|nr:ribonuclease T [Echinimonas agarilytica]MCM2680828.1 ribonuclease T [Echinimonas agarilytica]